MKPIVKLSALAVLAMCAACAVAADPPPGKPAAPDEVVVLDDNTLWRHFLITRCAFVRKDGVLKAQDLRWGGDGGGQEVAWGEQLGVFMVPAVSTNSSPLPPADWTGLTVDDSAWPRVRLPQPSPTDGYIRARPQRREGSTATMLLRGKFEVKDPAQAKTCTLSLDYWGGVVVYLNGKEVLRRHVPGEKPDLLALADDYPDDAFVITNRKKETVILPDYCGYDADKSAGPVPGEPPFCDPAEILKHLALRERGVKEVALPAALLRPGTNVLAVEVHTAPFCDLGKSIGQDGYKGQFWSPIKLRHAQLKVSPAGAAAANSAGALGVRAWNVGVSDTVTAFDYGDPSDKLQPIAIRAARNGVFSGRLVVDSDQPIKGLQATVTDLVQASTGGKIPASAVRVRFAVAARQGKSWMLPHRFDGLLDAIPPEIPVVKDPFGRPDERYPSPALHPEIGPYWRNPITRSNLAARAVAPLWFTVRVPRDAKPGLYEGRVTISAEGLAPINVPLRVSVSDWVVPEPKDFRMHNLAYHVDDAVARHYDVPLWSEKHFELLGKSHSLMAEIGSRQVFLNLTAAPIPLSPNVELIRWIKQPDGGAKPDFAVFDQYLDMVAKNVGAPLPLRLNIWAEPGFGNQKAPLPSVPLLDPKTNKIERLSQPAFGTKEAVAFWQPIFTEIRQKIKARDWSEVTALGWHAAYGAPVEEVTNLTKQLWPETVWACVSHEMARNYRTKDPGVKIRYAGTCYSNGFPTVRGYRELVKPQAEILCSEYRNTWTESSLLSTYRRVGEDIALSGRDGVSDFGADLFPFKHPQGGYTTSPSAGMPSGPFRSVMTMLYPGPDGPVATERYEMFREGVELAEALIYIERAIQDKKLSPALQEKAEKALEARSQAFIRNWFTIRDMPADEDAKLLALAGEVARELEQKK